MWKVIRTVGKYPQPQPELIDMSGSFRINLFRRPFETDQYGVIDPIKGTGTKPGNTGAEVANTSTKGASAGTEAAKTSMEKIMLYIKEKPEITLAELADKSNLSRNGVRYIIDKLRANGTIVREGAQKNGRWILR